VLEYKKKKEKEVKEEQIQELNAEERIESDTDDLENKIDWDNN
jgi:hypothetical protein